MSDENELEYYGFKAAGLGKFEQWQEFTSSLIEQYPKSPRGELAERAYEMVVGSK